MLQPGDPAPDFTLQGTTGEGIDTYRLSEALGAGPVVLAFYPFDFSPECTREVCDIRDTGWFEFVPDLSIFGISTDGPFSSKAFANEFGLDFPLLTDKDGAIADRYGVLHDSIEGIPNVAKRATFLVDADGTIDFATVEEDPYAQADLDAVHEAIAALDA
jgi:peroxiredoxin